MGQYLTLKNRIKNE